MTKTTKPKTERTTADTFLPKLPDGRTVASLQEECDKQCWGALKVLREMREKILIQLSQMVGVMLYGNGIGDMRDVMRLIAIIHHIDEVESNLLDDTDLPNSQRDKRLSRAYLASRQDRTP